MSSFIQLQSEKVLDMISVFLNLLRLVLCPNIWSTLENVLCMLEKVLLDEMSKISIKFTWSNMSFKLQFPFDFLSG